MLLLKFDSTHCVICSLTVPIEKSSHIRHLILKSTPEIVVYLLQFSECQLDIFIFQSCLNKVMRVRGDTPCDPFIQRSLQKVIQIFAICFSIKEQLLLMFATFLLASGVVYAMYILCVRRCAR